jgi:hypothetical protein
MKKHSPVDQRATELSATKSPSHDAFSLSRQRHNLPLTQATWRMGKFACVVLTSWLAVLSWVPGASAQSGYFSSAPPASPTTQACSSCHTTADFPSGTCAACHGHGTHPNSTKNSMNITATPDKATYLPGEAMTVSVRGGYRSGSARAKLWDKDCSSVSCTTQDYVVGKGYLLNGQEAPFGGNLNTTLNWNAPTEPGTYVWSASWYGNIYDRVERSAGNQTTFGPLWLEDPDNGPGSGDPGWPAHGDEIVTFSFIVQGPGNTPPVALDDRSATPANTPVSIDALRNDNDADMDTLFVNSDYDATTVHAGSVYCDTAVTTPTPQCTYMPPPDFCGNDSFRYRAFDGMDASVNRATVSVQVGDSNPPAVTAPTPDLVITLSAGTPLSTTVPMTDTGIAGWLAAASATDPQDGTVSVSNNAPVNFPVGTTVVTFTATDVCGNTGSAQASVIIEIAGNSAPLVSAPGHLMVNAPLCTSGIPRTDSQLADWLGLASAFDAEDGALPVVNTAPVNFPIGSTLVTFTATDSLGATGTAESTVTVGETPNAAPMVTEPAPLSITVPAGTTSVPVDDPTIADWLASASASDNEDGPLSVTHAAPAEFQPGTTTVTFSATDACGMTGTATSTVTIIEDRPLANNPPQLTAPAPITVAAALCAPSIPATDQAIASWLGSATANDTEDGSLTGSITSTAPANMPASVTPGTTTLVTFSVTDSGNPTGTPATTTATSTLTVVDPNTAPTLMTPAPLNITVPAGTISLPATDTRIAAWLALAAANDAQDGSLTVTTDAPADFQLGTTTVNFTATDVCGTSATATSTVTITEEGSVDAWLTDLKAPNKVSGKTGQMLTRSITVVGNGDTLTQEVTITLSVLSAPDNVSVVVTPAQITDTVSPGRKGTRFGSFDVVFDCIGTLKEGTVTWEASIDATQNGDATNDILTATSSVTCR